MAEWKKEIRRLAQDFCLSKLELQFIFWRVEDIYGRREIPKFYKGDRDAFLYDKAQTEIMSKICA